MRLHYLLVSILLLAGFYIATISKEPFIEFVEPDKKRSYVYSGDVNIRLIRPDGTVVELEEVPDIAK